MKKLIVGLCCALLPTAASAAHIANHLVITEVGYDTTTENAPTSEYIEIYNPTSSPITLNGTSGSYYVSDAQTSYFNIVSAGTGLVATGASDSLWQFPAGTVIPAHGIIVVASGATNFFTDFPTFSSQPGAPQLFETSNTDPNVPDMIRRSSGTPLSLSLSNSEEPAILFFWDGVSPTVKDVDIAVWGAAGMGQWPQKGAGYATDARTGTSSAPAGGNVLSVQRRSLIEDGESDTGGNGISGHDETTENISAVSDAGTVYLGWTVDRQTPGRVLLLADGLGNDAPSFLDPVAVSNADGPAGTANPADYGEDGTLTELYAAPVAIDGGTTTNGVYLAVRGSMFGEPTEGTASATFILIDTDPQTGTSTAPSSGTRRLNAASDSLSDVIGDLDFRITNAGFALGTELSAFGIDAVVGFDQADVSDPLRVGVRTFGTGGTAVTGSYGMFTEVVARLSYDGALSPLLPGKTGTNYAGQDIAEAVVRFSDLTPAATPTYLFLIAVTTSDNPGFPSPNTLPESTSDSQVPPHTLDKGVCFEVATGKVVTRYRDEDGDGVGGSVIACGPIGPKISATTGDCDDNDAARYPGNAEICDNKDNNCAGGVDDGLTFTNYYADADNDTYGVTATTISSCQTTAPTGYAARGGDCNDSSAAINPGAQEVCDPANVDENCSGAADDADTTATGKTTYYRDADTDTFGDPATTQQSCETAPLGYVADNSDCDDTSAAIKPGATEICDGKDNNCNGSTDEGVSTTVYRDADNDTFGDPGVTTPACAATPPSGYVTNNSDCNDSNAAIKPGATEIPGDGVDQNCDATEVCFADADNDGYRPNSTATVNSSDVDCADANEAVASDPIGDCNDSVSTINPGATELPADNTDQNCNGGEVCYADMDDDGYRPDATSTVNSADLDCADVTEATATDPTTDCNDSNSAINPAATELPGDGVDQNCDGAEVCYADADDDGFRPNGTATTNSADVDCNDANEATATDPTTDCNDTSAAAHPGAAEVCNAADDNCDGTQDEGFNLGAACNNGQLGACARNGFIACRGDGTAGCDAPTVTGTAEVCNGLDDDCDGTPDDSATDATTYYRDADSDTYGSATVTQAACTAPTGYVTNNADCDDTAASVHPTATETCNSTDDDCDGTVDEGVKTTFYADADADGVGGSTTQAACAAPTGYVSTTGDCDDTDLTVKPGATETCDTKDNNCDGTVDEGVKTTFYVDADGDGAGGTGTQDACSAPTGYVAQSNDCDDADSEKKPSGTEVCDGKDNNCNGTVDEGVQTTFYTDADGDGQGGQSSVSACTAPAGTATNSDDCNDANAAVKKGDKEEVCGDALDNDCDGKVDADDVDDCKPEQIAPESACGCSSGSSAMFAPALLMALALIGRRRRA